MTFDDLGGFGSYAGCIKFLKFELMADISKLG